MTDIENNKPSGEKDINKLISNMEPVLNPGTYVFSSVPDSDMVPSHCIISQFREQEGITIILSKEDADEFNINYSFESAWITLKVHSSLHAVGLTAAFANALSTHNISCNVISGYYHDHIFVGEKDKDKAMEVLQSMSENDKSY